MGLPLIAEDANVVNKNLDLIETKYIMTPP